MAAVSAFGEGGILAMAVDEALRPLHSAAAIAQQLGKRNSDEPSL
jgi:hypothetical protein